MAQFKAINPNVEVNGQTVLSIANAMGGLQSAGMTILSENGIVDPKPDVWYKQQNWLDAFKKISEKIGPNTLFVIGRSIPENAKFPPQINDIYKALSAIDVAYHMNHRLEGKVMFDPVAGKMTEGIGHYQYKKVSDTRIEITCDNPYPPDFDRGIIEAMAKKFRPEGANVKVEHDETKGCRKKGDLSCLYIVTW